MPMNHAEIIHIEMKYLLMNTERKTIIIWSCFYVNVNVNMLIEHYTILLDNYNL